MVRRLNSKLLDYPLDTIKVCLRLLNDCDHVNVDSND